MSERVLIASDSTCDLSKELIEQYGIKILPLGVTLGDKQYTDGVDITPEDIYEEYEKVLLKKGYVDQNTYLDELPEIIRSEDLSNVNVFLVGFDSFTKQAREIQGRRSWLPCRSIPSR